MEYFGEAGKKPPKETAKPEPEIKQRPTKQPIPWGVIGGVIALAVGVFALSFFSRNAAPYGGGASPSLNEQSAKASSIPYVAEHKCGCFNEGRRLAATNATVLEAEYRLGFVSCRKALGPIGGLYWTAGWNSLRSRDLNAPKHCRAVR